MAWYGSNQSVADDVSNAFMFSDSGTVVGDGSAAGAFQWSETEGSKTFVELGVSPSTAQVTAATAICSSGQVVGEAISEGDHNRNAFFWEEGAGITDIGNLTGRSGFTISFSTWKK